MPTAHAIRRFIKDYELPIALAEPKHINYYLNLYDDVYHTREKYDRFIDLLNRLGDEEAFFSYSTEVQKSVLEQMKIAPAFKDFLDDSQELFAGHVWRSDRVPKGQVYKAGNHGKLFLSIDLKKANYCALKYYTRVLKNIPSNREDLVLGTDTFEDFIAQFTNEPYFAHTKKFRQVVFGNLNPKRQQKIQKYIIEQILVFLFDNGFFEENDLKDYTSDEIVFVLNDGSVPANLKEALESKIQEMNIDVHVDAYRLKWLRRAGEIADDKPNKFFVREFADGRIDFKNVESSLMPQAYKHYKGMTNLVAEDFMFYHSNGMIARYVEPVLWA